jgi:hypothetical protein
MSLASSSFPSVKYICASALCNIADLKQMRMRMVEEGVVQVRCGVCCVPSCLPTL